ncbi:MAG: helix-turn-helix transcriptional regulator [Thermomicrobiales bacterium]
MSPGLSQSVRLSDISPPLVGRDAERAQLREELERARSGNGRLVLIGGEAGIGKTTLARELCREALAEQLTVLVGHCFDLTATPPYGPWLDLASHYRPDGDLPPLPDALLAGKIDEIDSQTELFEQVRAFLSAVAEVQPTVIVIEDLHWADPASLDLLRSIVSRLGTAPILTVVTYRVDELTRRHPFYHQLPGLVRDAEGRRIDLHRLPASDFDELISLRWQLSEEDHARLVDYLAHHADGNPFFAVELLRTLEEEGLLYRNDGTWALAQLDHIFIPPLLQQVIDGRVARLGEEMRQPLAMASIIGQEAPLALWSTVSKIEPDQLLTIVERAVDANLLEATRDGTRVRFVHALTREALYDSVLPPRRREWHRLVGEALALDSASNPDSVAHHFREAGDDRTVEWLIRSGERAQRAYAWITAVERFSAAADLLHNLPGQEETRALLLFRCGRLQRFANAAGAIDGMIEAERLARIAGDDILAADAVYSRGLLGLYSDNFRSGLLDFVAGIEELETLPSTGLAHQNSSISWMADSLPSSDTEEDSAIVAGSDELLARGIHHRRGGMPWFKGVAGYIAVAEIEGYRFIAAVDELAEMGGLVRNSTGHAHHGMGITAASLGELDRSRQQFALARHHYGLNEHFACIAFTYLEELRDAVMVFDTTNIEARRQLAANGEDALRRASGAISPGLSPKRPWLGIHLLEGRWDKLREIANDTEHHGNYVLRREVHSSLAPLARYQGEPDHARIYIRYGLPQGSTTEPGGMVFVEGLLMLRLAASIELDQGNLSGARPWLEANDRWLSWNNSVIGRAENQALWARFHLVNRSVDQAIACAKRAVMTAETPRQPLALLEALRTLAECEIEAKDLRSADDHLTAALNLADACIAPFERALTLLAMAEMAFETGNVVAARTRAQEARDICLPLGAMPTITRVDELQTRIANASGVAAPMPAKLTQREVEVLRLVASGLTDAGVAERLYISPRTVSQHLQSIYNKLDVSTRSAATRFAVEHGLT